MLQLVLATTHGPHDSDFHVQRWFFDNYADMEKLQKRIAAKYGLTRTEYDDEDGDDPLACSRHNDEHLGWSLSQRYIRVQTSDSVDDIYLSEFDDLMEKMKPFEPKQLHVTLERDDVATLKNIVAANLDDSGIIAHILDEMVS